MTTKTKKGRFTPWCWEAERDEYNDESRRGWHLAKRTLRDMTYEYAPEKQYRYAIDYRMEHHEDQYLEMFEDDGWELVGTVVDGFKASQPGKNKFVSKRDGCWYIFRKEYDPTRPDADYEIATDKESLREFRRTLTQKYRRLLIPEIILFLWHLILNIVSHIWLPINYIILASFGLAALSAGYRLLCLNVFRPRKPIRLFIDFSRIMATVCIVYALIFFVYIAVTEHESRIPITAENTPVNLFLALEPDTTYSDVQALSHRYGWDTTVRSWTQTNDGKIQSYYVEIGVNEELLFLKEEVTLQLCFSPADNELDAAMLTINTRDGSAYCAYIPNTLETDPYTLTLHPSGQIASISHSPASAREAVDLAYSVVYPEGLE